MDRFQKIFEKLPQEQAPEELFGKILFAIEEKNRSQGRIRLAIFSGLFLVGLIALIPASINLYNSMINSGSLEMLTLLRTNVSQVAGVWQDFVISLLEYLPVLSLAIFLAVIFLLIFSFGSTIRYAKSVFIKLI